MYLRRAVHLGLALLVAAGSGVCGSASEQQTKKTSKSSAASATSQSHRSPNKPGARRTARGQHPPARDRISEIQQALGKEGSFNGTPNGTWDDSTVGAMKNFQSTHGLNPTGKLDALTLQKLGLGSQTAGVAPPVPPPNSASRLVSSVRPSRQ
jgi:peptidoglycan hydrolase-like protein with peptidoglycan-binding domain